LVGYIFWVNNLKNFNQYSYLNESNIEITKKIKNYPILTIYGGANDDKFFSIGKSKPGRAARNEAIAHFKNKNRNGIFANAFSPNQKYNSGPHISANNKALSCRNNAKINKEQHYFQDDNKKPPILKDSIETWAKRVSDDYKEFQELHNTSSIYKRYDTQDYDEKRLIELPTDPSTGEYNRRRIDEARAVLYAEELGLVINPKKYFIKMN